LNSKRISFFNLGALFNGKKSETQYNCVHHLQSSERDKFPPILIVRAGLESRPEINESIDRFIAAGLKENVAIDLLTHPEGEHFFDVYADNDRSREIIRKTLSFMQDHLSHDWVLP
jgi:hypothetical protein